MSARDFDAIGQLARESHVWRAIRRAGRVSSAAWAESRLSDVARRAARGAQSWQTAERVQAAAIVVASAGAGHLALRAITPSYVASRLPGQAFLVVTLAALLVAIYARAVVAAWPDSALARIARLARKNLDR